MFPGRRSWQQHVSLSGGPSGQKEEVYWQPREGTAARSPCQKSGCYIGGEKKAKAGPLPRSRHGACMETRGKDLRPCHWDVRLQKPGPGGTHQSDAGTVLRRAVPGARRCWAVLAGRRAAEPGAGAASEVTHSPTWPKLFGAQRGDFLKTSVLQRLLRLERAAALVSPCPGLSAYVFSLSTAVLDRPPAHPFTSLKGPRPLLQHLKRQCWESQQ